MSPSRRRLAHASPAPTAPLLIRWFPWPLLPLVLLAAVGCSQPPDPSAHSGVAESDPAVQPVDGRAHSSAPAAALPWPAVPADITVPDISGGGPRMTAVDQVRIAGGLLEQYLGHFRSEEVPEAERLKDFRYDSNRLNVIEDQGERLVYQVEFSVLPAAGAGVWKADGGRQAEGGWIQQTGYLTAARESGRWRLVSLAPSRLPDVK